MIAYPSATGLRQLHPFQGLDCVACRATRGCCVRQMAFTAYDGNSEAINFLDASLSENGSSTEESICTDTTVTDSDTSYYDRQILHKRFSRPQFVDQWAVYVLARKNPYRTGEALDGWVWKKALTCPAREPLSKANIFLLYGMSEIGVHHTD